MNKILLFLSISILTFSACAPLATATPEPVETQTPAVLSPTEADQSSTKQYANNVFGFGFQYPFDWFGPDEYVSDQTLRVAVGSDIVYPYGEAPEQPSEIRNSYSVVIQYTKNNQNGYWKDTYQSLLDLKDGESLSGARSLIIRVSQINVGRFQGFEYISTLSGTAQTEHVYAREVILVDPQSNDLLTIFGTPYNVEVGDGAEWRDVYRTIDEANLAFFHEIVESIIIE